MMPPNRGLVVGAKSLEARLLTKALLMHLDDAIRYENAMEVSCVLHPRRPGSAYLPVARSAYLVTRALVLGWTPAPNDDPLGAIQSAFLAIRDQPHYDGVQFTFMVAQVDDWLHELDAKRFERGALRRAFNLPLKPCDEADSRPTWRQKLETLRWNVRLTIRLRRRGFSWLW